MSKTRLVVELDDQDPYDAQAIKILSQSTEAERKGMLVSGLLYWVRSPAFSLTDRIDALLAALQGQGFQVAPTIAPVAVPAQKPLAGPMRPIPTVFEEVRPSAPVSADVPEDFGDGSDNAFQDLFSSTI